MQTERNYKKLLFTGAALGLLSIVFLYDSLVKGAGLGVNVPLFITLFYIAVFLSFQGEIDLKREQNWALLVLIAGDSVTFALYNSALLLFLNFAMLAILIPLQINLMTGKNAYPPYQSSSFFDIGFTLFVRPFHKMKDALLGFFPTEDKKKRTHTWSGILIGLIVLIPLMIVLTLLLASADMVFSDLLGNVLKFLSIRTVFDAFGWAFLFLAVFLVFSSMTVSLWNVKKATPKKAETSPLHTNLLAIYIILASAGLLLLVFSAIQGLFLFGSAKLPAGVTYSQYARTGFFQLCAAAVIVLSLLTICMRLTKDAEKRNKTALRLLYTGLLACTLVLIASSFMRLVLYEQEFLFTRLRLYVQAFLILLTLVTAGVIMKIWRAQFNIAKFLFFSAAACLIGLSIFNVDLFIGTQNAKQLDMAAEIKTEEGYLYYDAYTYRFDPPSDLDYLLSLSVDALPGYLGQLTPAYFKLTYGAVYNKEKDLYSYSEEAHAFDYIIALRSSRLLRLVEEATGPYAGDIRYLNFSRETVGALLNQMQDVIETARQSVQQFYFE